jgi:Family of unknown function (DUF5686)/CarboxypepD_reg-like domain
MKRQFIFTLAISFLHLIASGQLFTIHGKVVDRQLEPLALASIEVKDQKKGTITNEDGNYELNLHAGKYDFIITMIGYETRVVTVLVNGDIEQNFILVIDEGLQMEPVVIKAKAKDRAEEVIRGVINHKDAIMAVPGTYSCYLYIKAARKDSFASKRNKTIIDDSSDLSSSNKDFSDMSMAEISLKLDYASSNQYKEQRVGVSEKGKSDDLFYLTTSDGDFNLYNNLLKVPAVAQIPLISPVSYSGLIAYRYKTLKIDYFGKRKVYTISVKPRLVSNATIEGELVIDDSAKTILSSKISFPSFHMPEYDFFEVEQQYSFVNDTAWMITRQEFNYYSKSGRNKISGQTIVSYSGFELNKKFRRNYFGNEVSVTTAEAYEKDSLFWRQARTEPLTDKEVKFIQYQDSIYNLTRSEEYLDSLDAVMNKVTWKNLLLFGQVINYHKKERRWVLPPATAVIQPFQFGGLRLNLLFLYTKTFSSRKNINIATNVSYGFRNRDVNGRISVRRLYNPYRRGYYEFSAGRNFDFIFDGDAWINMLKRSNIYLNNSFAIGHEVELLNGLTLLNNFEIALRRSVSGYKTNPKVDSLFGDILTNNQAVAFDPYNAFYNQIRLSYTPKQKFLREPKEKIILGSKFPAFYIDWIKGIPGIFNSKIDFDYLELGISQRPKFGILGNGAYIIKTGSFLNKKDLRLIDYKYQRRGDPLLFLDPHKAFQALDSTFPVFRRFYEGHYVHDFNGYFLNKIPFLKKIKLREVAGGGILFAPERSLVYGELFAGIEREFKWPPNPLTKFKIGVYIVTSYANQFTNPVQFKIGLTTWDWLRDRWR